MTKNFIFSILVTIFIGYQVFSFYYKLVNKKFKNPYFIFLYALTGILQICLIVYVFTKIKII